MKGFSRTLKNAVYMGCKSGLWGIVVCLVNSGFFCVMSLSTGFDFSWFYASGILFLIYGVMLMLFDGALFTTSGLSMQLSMGCTRKHAVYGNAVMDLVHSAILCAGVLMAGAVFGGMGKGSVIGSVLEGQGAGGVPDRLIAYGSLFLMAAGLGACMGILVDKLGKWAYNITIIVCSGASGLCMSLAMSGNIKISFDFLQSPILPVIALIVFSGGYLFLQKYVSRLDIRL